MIRVNEIFGPTVQGEGPHAGRYCGFVRFAECNLSCSWCDTPYTWDWTRFDRAIESRQMTLEEVAERILALYCHTIVLTGGEPMMHQRFFPDLYEETGCWFDVETNGTIIPTSETIEAVDLFIVSPKLAHSGDPERLRIKPLALDAYAALAREGKAAFKWVVETPADLDAVGLFCDEYEIPRTRTWAMPEGANRAAHLENLIALADDIVAHGFNLSTRLHVLAWNDKRGV